MPCLRTVLCLGVGGDGIVVLLICLEAIPITYVVVVVVVVVGLVVVAAVVVMRV
jgi:hypothetical protein